MEKSVSILGMGNIGQGLAAHFLSNDYKVFAWNRLGNQDKISLLKRAWFHYKGKNVGRVEVLEKNLSSLIFQTKIIIISTTANAHREIIDELKNIKNKLIIIIPGCFGSYYCFKRLEGNKIFEINPPPFNIRVSKIGRFLYFNEVDNYYIGSQYYDEDVLRLFPKGEIVHPLLSSLNNIEMILHPVIALNNKDKKKFNFYREGVNAKIVEVIKAVDEERIQLGRYFNITIDPIEKMFEKRYKHLNNTKYPENLVDIFRNTKPFVDSNITFDRSSFSRYIYEEVPFRLVPFYFLGIECGLKMKNTKYIIEKANKSEGINFFEYGRKLNINDVQ